MRLKRKATEMPKRKAARPADLIGTWRRQDGEPGTQAYPKTLTFAESTYRGTRDPDQGFVVWDAGIYRSEHIDNAGSLIVGTASDELITYPLERTSADSFTVIDPAGCRITYLRQR